jgi:hypothetical protein
VESRYCAPLFDICGLHCFYRNALTGYGVVSRGTGGRLRNNCHNLRGGGKCDPQDEGQKVEEDAASQGLPRKLRMDPVTTAIAKEVGASITETAKESSKSFLSAVLHEPAQELGSLLGDRVRERRHKNLIKITARAQERLREAGLTAREVPLSIIHPALEAASLEENPDLQDIWANLLANAATTEVENAVYPSFPSILKELRARDVKFLDALFRSALVQCKNAKSMMRVESVLFNPIRADEIYSAIGLGRVDEENQDFSYKTMVLDNRDRHLSMDTFERHNIIAKVYDVVRRVVDDEGELGMAYSFTSLGACFVRACRNPRDDK